MKVDVSGSGGTRAMSAATLVDRMMEPENFVLMLDENKFGPVNAVVSSVRARRGSFSSLFPSSFFVCFVLEDDENVVHRLVYEEHETTR